MPSENSTTRCPEVVGLLPDRSTFDACISELAEAGFAHADLSVLASHESIDAAEPPGQSWRDVLTALTGEVRFEAPLVASGAILYAGGPTMAVVAGAGALGLAVGSVALREALDSVTARPHTEAFAKALEQGSVALWVRVETPEREELASDIMTRLGATGVHTTDPDD